MSTTLLTRPSGAPVQPEFLAGRGRVATGRDINDLSCARGWSRSRLVLELRRTAAAQRTTLPGDDSLKRMIRLWANGQRGLSPLYAGLLTTVFGVRFEVSAAWNGCPGCGGTSSQRGSCAGHR